MTGLDRDIWADARSEMIRDETNRESLAIIDSALICGAFDERTHDPEVNLARFLVF